MSGRSLEKIDNALSEIKAAGIKGTLSALQLDVTDEASVGKAVQSVEKDFGHLDALVNNAAVGNRDPNIRLRMQQNLNVNVVGPAVVAAAFRPLLLKSPNPYSIYVSSGQGSLTGATDPKSHVMPNAEAYRSSKAALNMLAIVEGVEFGPHLKVFPVCPGFVRSNLRGESEEARSGAGQAGDPEVSGQMILNIIQGNRDADVGKFVHKDGTYPW